MISRWPASSCGYPGRSCSSSPPYGSPWRRSTERAGELCDELRRHPLLAEDDVEVVCLQAARRQRAEPDQGRVDSPDLGIDILVAAWSLDRVALTPGSRTTYSLRRPRGSDGCEAGCC